MKGKTPISQEKLQQAVKKYLKSGGQIQKLPDEKIGSPALVGGKYNNAEVESRHRG